MKEQNKKKILLRLFLSTLYLSAFTFGGGYVIVTLMKKKFVDECHWIEENEMLDLVAIAQSSPGAIAVNGAIVVGYKLSGILGALVAILGTVLPPFVILSVISVFYKAFRNNWLISQLLEGMQAGVGAVIASVTLDMGIPIVKEKEAVSLIIMVGAFVAACLFGINVVYIVIVCGIIGIIRTKFLYQDILSFVDERRVFFSLHIEHFLRGCLSIAHEEIDIPCNPIAQRIESKQVACCIVRIEVM